MQSIASRGLPPRVRAFPQIRASRSGARFSNSNATSTQQRARSVDLGVSSPVDERARFQLSARRDRRHAMEHDVVSPHPISHAADSGRRTVIARRGESGTRGASLARREARKSAASGRRGPRGIARAGRAGAGTLRHAHFQGAAHHVTTTREIERALRRRFASACAAGGLVVITLPFARGTDRQAIHASGRAGAAGPAAGRPDAAAPNAAVGRDTFADEAAVARIARAQCVMRVAERPSWRRWALSGLRSSGSRC